MNIYKKILAIIMNIVLFLQFISPIALAIETNQTKYLALGDSIAYGYGLANRDAQSYPQIVRKNYGISESNFSNLAISGMTCAQFYEKIQTTEYKNAIKDADIITTSIGSNELLKIAVGAVSTTAGIESSDPDFANKVKDYFSSLGYLAKAQAAYKLYSYFTSEETKKVIDDSINTYEEKWKKSVEYIKSVNPDVVLVATQFYNPYYEIGLASYDLGSYVDEFIKRMNKILEEQSKNESEYKIARIYEDFNTTDPRITNVNVDFNDFSNINIDPHPNKDGHNIISTRVLETLKTAKQDTKKDIKELAIESISDYDYTGSEIKPKVIIKDGNIILKENTDYTVTYINNIEVGKTSVIIKGIGGYKGTVTKTFNIKNKETTEKIDINSLNISKIEDQTYMGIKITPDIELKTSNNTKLNRNTDYTLRYYDNINVGTATIEIVGIGNYLGTKSINFKIEPKDISNTIMKDIDNQKYTGSQITPNLQITDGSAILVENKDYELSYKDNTQIGEATIKITGKGNYTGNTTKTFNIVEDNADETKKNISELNITDVEEKVYTGKLITPEVMIKDGDATLIKDKDYKINYEDNLFVGTGKIIITGIGNYNGLIRKTFDIVKKDINYTQIVDIQDQIFTGEEIRPDIIITSDSIKLKEGQDYIINYYENKSKGTAKVIITGINNYTGETVKTFNIVTKDNGDRNKEEETEIINTNYKDNTTSPKILPYTGTIKAIILSMILVALNGVYFYKKYYKNKDII